MRWTVRLQDAAGTVVTKTVDARTAQGADTRALRIVRKATETDASRGWRALPGTMPR